MADVITYQFDFDPVPLVAAMGQVQGAAKNMGEQIRISSEHIADLPKKIKPAADSLERMKMGGYGMVRAIESAGASIATFNPIVGQAVTHSATFARTVTGLSGGMSLLSFSVIGVAFAIGTYLVQSWSKASEKAAELTKKLREQNEEFLKELKLKEAAARASSEDLSREGVAKASATRGVMLAAKGDTEGELVEKNIQAVLNERKQLTELYREDEKIRQNINKIEEQAAVLAARKTAFTSPDEAEQLEARTRAFENQREEMAKRITVQWEAIEAAEAAGELELDALKKKNSEDRYKTELKNVLHLASVHKMISDIDKQQLADRLAGGFATDAEAAAELKLQALKLKNADVLKKQQLQSLQSLSPDLAAFARKALHLDKEAKETPLGHSSFQILGSFGFNPVVSEVSKTNRILERIERKQGGLR